MLTTFKAFLDDDDAWDMYITGRAGTGKTWGLNDLAIYCLANEIDMVASAYTHKALGELAKRLPAEVILQTLHSFLCKRPTINANATNSKHIESSKKQGNTAKTSVLFVDEYSMVGERDYCDLVIEQEEGLKIVWIGDPYQIPAVKDIQVVYPRGDYQVMLKEQKRKSTNNPLCDTVEQMVSFIEGEPIVPLAENSNFIRGQNLVEAYDQCATSDKVILTYTNQNVQYLNERIQGYSFPKPGDMLFSPTTQKRFEFMNLVDSPTCIELPFGDPLMLDSKFKTLEYLVRQGTQFAELITEEGDSVVMAFKFGHYDYKTYLEELKIAAAGANANIEKELADVKAVKWAKKNYNHPLAKARAKAWRNFLSFNECVICLDFTHALTIHKSQGSTYDTVFLDLEDIHIAAKYDFQLYLRLMYVALSRASNKVVTT